MIIILDKKVYRHFPRHMGVIFCQGVIAAVDLTFILIYGILKLVIILFSFV